MTGQPLPWGYTWQELETLARRAAATSRARVLPWAAQAEAALDGVVTALAEAMAGDGAATPPTRYELVSAGYAAVNAAESDYRGQHGIPTDRAGTGGRFAAYWRTADRNWADPMEHIDDRLALAQIWPKLSAGERETIAALAFYLSHRETAAAFGISHGAWHMRISKARKTARILWFTPETAPRHYHNDIGSLENSGSSIRSRVTNRRSERRRSERRRREAA